MHLWLGRAGRTMARHDALSAEQAASLPWPARCAYGLARFGTHRPSGRGQLTAALYDLGPSYIKLGQFLATRPDIVGKARADELRALQDKLPPFGMDEARAMVKASLGAEVDTLFSEFGPPVAAASIAQVHKARTRAGHEVAVKILRPAIEERFESDLQSFFFAARMAERTGVEARRLRPVDAVATLAQSVKIEMDLRMEAAAIAEMARNIAEDRDFRVPQVEWPLTARRVLTCEWIAGTPLAESAPVEPIEFVRIVALARIMMPTSYVRLSAGRSAMSDETQALCFFAGANSIFVGDTLLTAGNPEHEADRKLFQRLGLQPI